MVETKQIEIYVGTSVLYLFTGTVSWHRRKANSLYKNKKLDMMPKTRLNICTLCLEFHK